MAKEIRGDSEELWYGTEWVGNSLFCFHGKKLGSKGKGCGEAALCSYLELLKVKVAQLCPTLWPGILQARKLGVGSLFSLQEIVPTQGSNPGLPHGRGILYQLSHKGSQFLRPVQNHA